MAKKESGIDSSIKKVYVISQSHIDIGFNYPPEEMGERCKTWIDRQISYARTHPGFRYTIEHTWMFENWRARSTEAEINEMMGLLRSGQFELGAAHSTLHSGKAGVEAVNRLMWNAERYRRMYDIPVETMLFNDVPGVSWAYPQVLAKSGIKRLVCGLNLTLGGGGFSQPYASYLFRWQGPDGSKILTWSTKNIYNEGFKTYGIPFGGYYGIRKSMLTSALGSLTNAQYPYDAVLVMHSADANVSQSEHRAAKSWNNVYTSPQIITTTPREFFEYMEAKYGAQIPSHGGNWTTRWDTSQMQEPQSEKVRKNAQDLVPTAEKAWAIANALGKGSYPEAEFENAWEMMLTGIEHTGAGASWPGYWTQAQVDRANEEYWNYGRSCLNSTTSTLESGAAALFSCINRPGSESIAVFNPLSWASTDLVRVKISSTLYSQSFKLVDAVSSQEITYQKNSAASEILFVAKDVPAVGYKCYDITHTAPALAVTSLKVSSNSVENNWYRITVNPLGYVTSILDKRSSKEIISTTDPLNFNRPVSATNIKYMGVNYDLVPDPAFAAIETGMNGPVAASLKISYDNHLVAATQIILYENIDRIDLINTVDRTKMQYAPLSVNSRYYGFAFPFNVPDYTRSSIDTAAGWLVPASDSMPGSFTQSHAIQHAIDMSSSIFGITFATPDVYVHSFGAFNTSGGFSPPTKPSVFSSFIRCIDEGDLIGDDLGKVTIEPVANSRWDVRYSFRPHARGFDAVEDARFGWQVCTPMLARQIAPSGNGKLAANEASFFSVSAPNVVITDIKKAGFGERGLIIKLQEIAKTATVATLIFPLLQINSATLTTPLEKDLTSLAVKDGKSVSIEMGSAEIKTLRLVPEGNTGVQCAGWALYQ